MWKDSLKKHLHVNPMFASLVLGHLAAYGMGPFYKWPIYLVCLSLYWITLTRFSGDKQWKSWASGFLFGFGFFVSGLWWIGNALLVGGNDFKWAYPLAVCGLPILFSVYPMLACGIVRRFAKGRSIKSLIVFIFLFFGSEYARGYLFTGFPWNLSGMVWTGNLAMLQILSVGGIYLLSFLTIFMAVSPAFVWKGTGGKWTKVVTGLLAILCGSSLYLFGKDRLAEHPTTYNTDVVVQMIQPNIAQADKWNADKKWDNYRATMALIEKAESWPKAKTRVVIMPETTLTYRDLETEQAVDYLRGRMTGYEEKTVYLLSGALLHDDAGYHNSLLVLDRNVDFLESFDKFHLVPFGEYIPFQKYIPLPTITEFSGFAEGSGPRTLTHPDLPPFSPLVCYEVIFPGQVTSKTDLRPEWMVNVTNDAWYGLSPGPYQHLSQAQYRAIEEGLPMVRVANTGISAVIDPYGRIVTAAGLNQPANIESALPRPAEPTLYSKMR